MKVFQMMEVQEAIAYSLSNKQALHLHNIIVDRSRAPRCFVQAVDRKEPIAHLFDQNKDRVTKLAKLVGVNVIYIDKEGTNGQHIDLCGGPLRWLLNMHAGKLARLRKASSILRLVQMVKQYKGAEGWL